MLASSPSNENRRILEASSEKGASNWLNVLPIKDEGFYLEKQAFWDSLYLRYNIKLRNVPAKCVCGKAMDVDHALSCHKGGFINIRHNEIRNFTGKLMDETHRDVRIEPELTKLTGEKFQHATANVTDEARVDIAARGVWVTGQMAYFDVRVFNPIAKTFMNSDLAAAHRRNENEKKRSYSQRINRVDSGSFTPLVFSCLGGMSKECRVLYDRLACKLAEKRGWNYSLTVNWIRT